MKILTKLSICIALTFITLSACAKTNPNQSNSVVATTQETADSVASPPKKVSILGDSYSTFSGYIPEGFIAWYMPVPKEGRPTDVTKVEQTWWDMFIKNNGYQLETNNSYSGSTICNTGYDKKDYSDRSFISRVDQLGNPDIILVYGGTNDSWANSPLGDFVYEGWTTKQLKQFRPATAYLTHNLKEKYPEAQIVFLVNNEEIIKPEIISSFQEICNHYGVQYVVIEDISRMSGHPDQNGMISITGQLEKALANSN